MRRIVWHATVVFFAAQLGAALAQGIPGNDHSFELGASPDGRYSAFTSNATNLVPNDTNGAPDVFVFDRQTTSVTRASVNADGAQGNNISEHPSISADGQQVAFDSAADNFDGTGGPYIKDLGSGFIERLDTVGRGFPSLSDDGNVVAWDRGSQLRLLVRDVPTVVNLTSPPGDEGDFLDWGVVVSGDGAYAAFATKRTFAGINDTNGHADVYRYRVSSPLYEKASNGPTESGANGPSGGVDVSTSYKRIAISGDGARVAFYSVATNMTAMPAGGVFVFDFDSDTVRQVAACNPCNESFYALSLSSDGNWLAFYSIGAFQEVPSMTPRTEGYYLYDYSGQTLKRLAGNTPGIVTVGQAFAATAVSTNGTQVLLQTNETFAGIPDRSPFADIFLLPQPTGAAVLASRAVLGAIDEGQSRMPALSGDGSQAAFASFASNLGPADTNNVRDVYVRTIGTDLTRLASTTAGGAQGNGESRNPALSEDGRYVVFISDASNLTPDDVTGNLADVFLKDLTTGAIERVSRSTLSDGGGVFLASAPALSADAGARYVAFTSGADFLGDGVFGVDAYIRDRVANTIVRASPTFDGNDPDISCNVCGHSLSLSDDGRYLAFQALANNQLPSLDGDDAFDVFVYDRNTDTVQLVSRDTGAAGEEADCDNVGPTISGDGRFVGFWSCASNLPGANGGGAIYVRDRTANTTTRVAASPRIVEFLGAEPGPVFSRDGALLAFVSFARDLVAGDTNALPDAFVFERGTGRITRASLSAAFNQANGASYTYDLVESIPRFYGLALDRSGSRLALAAAATNLAGDDRNAADDVFVFDRATQAVERASGPSNPPTAFDLLGPAVSGDGRFAVALRTDRQGALAGEVAGKRGKLIGDKFGSITRYDWNTQTQVQVDVSSTELPANGNSKLPAISPTGDLVSFASEADNLGVAADTNGAIDVFLRDQVAGTTIPITAGANADSGQSAVTTIGDKYVVAVETLATNLTGVTDTNGASDIVVAIQDAANTLASVSTGGIPANGASTQPSISADGRFVGFTSLGTNLVSGDDNNAADVFLRDLTGGTTTIVSVALNGDKPNGASGAAQVVARGVGSNDWIASFESDASDIVFSDPNFETDVFVRERVGLSETNELVSVGFDGSPANGRSFAPALSPDGRYVAFTSTASNLVPGDDNDAPDVFLYDRVTETTTLVSVSTAGTQANDHPLRPAVGFAGGEAIVVWDTPADNLVPGDTNQAYDLYRRPVVSGVTQGTASPILFADGFEQ